ncbi:MAG: GAK system XXXCH domain-containing protein [Desulfohalobiaceae bacterium]
MNKKRHYRFEMNREEAVQALRSLAQGLEDRVSEVSDLEIDLSQMRKMKLSLKAKTEDQFQLKVKVNPWQQEELEAEEDGEEAAFARLKKRMQTYFEELQQNLQSGLYPSREIVSVFLQDCRQLTDYPGIEEQDNQEFQQACLEFQKSFDMEDMAAMQQALVSISSQMRNCHQKNG